MAGDDGTWYPAVMRTVGVTLLALCVCATASAAVAQAEAKCYCVANGARFEQGQVACLRSPQGPRPARCEKVLNNSAWKFLDDPCSETSSLAPKARIATASPDAR